MKVINERLYDEKFDEAEEFVLLKQKKFYEENKEYFPLLVRKGKKLEKIYFKQDYGFMVRSLTEAYQYSYICFSDIEDRLEKMEIDDFDAFWGMVNEIVEKKMNRLSRLVEIAKKQLNKYKEKKEKNKVYGEYIQLKMAEKLRNE